MGYTKHFNTRKTSQSQPIPGSDQVKNRAGGYVWEVDKWTRLHRFLILGTEGGTYYAGERTLTIESANAVIECLAEDGVRVVDTAVEISDSGRAPKNDPAIFVMALAMSPKFADTRTRQIAADGVANRRVIRIATHMFKWQRDLKNLRGYGRLARKASAGWYNNMLHDDLVYQLVKYRQRVGWTHRDVLRMAHPVPENAQRSALYKWVTSGEFDYDLLSGSKIEGMLLAQGDVDKSGLIKTITDYGLTWEMIPNKWLKDADVWAALLPRMPMTAMMRNLSNMTRAGLIAPMSEAASFASEKLNSEAVLKQRVHPLNILVAMRTYASGRGFRGTTTWSPVGQVVDALDGAFYHAFGNITPTNKRWMLALDVSGSMNHSINKMPLTAREASAAMSLVTARTESKYVVTVFSEAGTDLMRGSRKAWLTPGISSWDISPRVRLDDLVNRTSRLGFAGTDCALPMLYALKKKWEIDVFAIYTDNESWSGDIHPAQALEKYRQEMGIDSKMVVVAMTADKYSIADPNDPGMLDVVGFDTAAPEVMSQFVAGIG